MIRIEKGVPLNNFFLNINPQSWDKSKTVELDNSV